MRRYYCLFSLLFLLVAPLAADQQSDLLTLVNKFRASQGVGQLSDNPLLDKSAGNYSKILATQAEFSHTVGGTTVTSRDRDAGYTGNYLGENIARGFFDPQTTETAWENSPGHRANLLNPNFKDIGIGVAMGPFGQSWVEDFGVTSATPPPVTPPPITPLPIVPPVAPSPPPQVFTLIGKFSLFKDNLGNYVLLPAQ